MAAQPELSPPRADYSGLVILVVLGVLEVVILYVLIAVETPLSPVVGKAIRDPGGLFAVVLSGVTILCVGMALLLTGIERRRRRRDR